MRLSRAVVKEGRGGNKYKGREHMCAVCFHVCLKAVVSVKTSDRTEVGRGPDNKETLLYH